MHTCDSKAISGLTELTPRENEDLYKWLYEKWGVPQRGNRRPVEI